MKLVKLIFIFSLAGMSGVAQNLVPNPSFEEVIKCPQGPNKERSEFLVPGWNSPNTGTPDIFHKCSNEDADVPYNWAGASNARSGQGYAGIYVWNKRADGINYREYLQCELAEPLVQGKKYKIQFYYKLSSYSVYASNRIGLVLDNSPINQADDGVISRKPLISIEGDFKISNSMGGWEEVSLEYVAQGGERFLTIGNFFNNEATKNMYLPYRYGKSQALSENSFFFIDDVSVVMSDAVNKVSSSPFYSESSIEPNKSYVLNIQFEFDTHILKQSSNDELEKVVSYLKGNTGLMIHLYGFVDHTGSDEFTTTLSSRRAWSVAEYLISKGIDSKRILSYGFGKARPIRTDKSEEARKTNSRVEVAFVMP